MARKANIEMPGITSNTDGIEFVRERLTDPEGGPSWTYEVGGMEHIKSPYLVLRSAGKGQLYFLLERRNDDGEWDAQLYDAPGDLDVSDPVKVLAAAAEIDDHQEPVDPIEVGLFEDVNDAMDMPSEILFGFRDVISPDALA